VFFLASFYRHTLLFLTARAPQPSLPLHGVERAVVRWPAGRLAEGVVVAAVATAGSSRQPHATAHTHASHTETRLGAGVLVGGERVEPPQGSPPWAR